MVLLHTLHVDVNELELCEGQCPCIGSPNITLDFHSIDVARDSLFVSFLINAHVLRACDLLFSLESLFLAIKPSSI